jgi:penicillin-binding protein-related factor A (putative recombinase)
VPPGFSIADASATEAKLLNKDTNETILLKIIDKNPQKEFENAVKSFQNNNNAELKNLSNKTVQHIEFKDTDSGKTTSFVFFEKVNHSFMLKMDNFNNSAQKEKDMMHIINTITHDFKQNK